MPTWGIGYGMKRLLRMLCDGPGCRESVSVPAGIKGARRDLKKRAKAWGWLVYQGKHFCRGCRPLSSY